MKKQNHCQNNDCRILKFIHTCFAFDTFSPKQKKDFVRSFSEEQLKFFCECCFNLQNKKVDISLNSKNKLRKYKKEIISLANPNLSLRSAKKTVLKGGFLPTLFTVLASTLTPILIDKLKNFGDNETDPENKATSSAD